jgi:hypothetical protein
MSRKLRRVFRKVLLGQYDVTREGGRLSADVAWQAILRFLFADPDGERNLNIVAGTHNRFC